MALCRQNAFYKSPKHLRANNRNKQSPRFFEYENDIKIYSNALHWYYESSFTMILHKLYDLALIKILR